MHNGGIVQPAGAFAYYDLSAFFNKQPCKLGNCVVKIGASAVIVPNLFCPNLNAIANADKNYLFINLLAKKKNN